MSLFSKRKKLIIGGCSYTDNYARQEKLEEFPLWGELLADKLDMEFINLGECGFGNKAIYRTITERYLTEKNVGLVVAMWSEHQRVSLHLDTDDAITNKNPWRCFHPERIIKDADWHDKFYKPPARNPKKQGLKYNVSKMCCDAHINSIKTGVLETLSYMHALQSVITVPVLQTQGCKPLMGLVEHIQQIQYKEFCKNIINSPYIDTMEKSFVGWPIDKRIGGYCMDDLLQDDHRISEEDTHPNAKGHKIMAEAIYDAYAKIYS